MLTNEAIKWPTPNASALNEYETPESWRARADKLKEKGYNGNGASMPLAIAAKELATPIARDWRSETTAVAFQGAPPLGRQVLQTGMVGNDGSEKAALSPFFVEALMGLPRGWTVLTVSVVSAIP